MQLVYRVVLQWGVTVLLYIALYSKTLNPTLHISRRSSIGSALGLESNDCWFEPSVRLYFSSNNVRLLIYLSLQVKTHNKNEWSVTSPETRAGPEYFWWCDDFRNKLNT